ncbi:hypothetical protein [Intestinibacter sp.]
MTLSQKTNKTSNFDKIKYVDGLILKLQILYSKNIVDSNFFDQALELLEQEKIDVLSYNTEINGENCIDKLKEGPNFEEMSEEDKKKYIDIEKNGIKMRMLEASNFSELDILYNRMSSKFENINYELDSVIKIEFTKNFEKLFKSSYIYYLIEDYKNIYGEMEINNLEIENGNLRLKNTQYQYTLDKENLKKQKIRDIDKIELESFKVILNDVYSRFTDEFIENKLKYIIKLPQRKFTLKERLEKIKKTMQKILNRDENRFFRSPVSIECDIKFKEKLEKCKTTYDTEFKDEVVLLIFDNTLFKTCERGFVITDKNFYFKNDINDNYKLNLNEIDTIELKDNILYINDNVVNCDIIQKYYLEKFADIMMIIMYLIQQGLENSKDIDSVIEEVLFI